MRYGTALVHTMQGDITKIDFVSAIVNAANKTLLGGGGVDGAIHRAAGFRLLRECISLHGCNTGEAKITSAYNLPCEYIIHTVGPVWKGGTYGEKELLANCYENSLRIAVDKGIRSIAFPSVSTGNYSFPLEVAADVAVHAVKEFLTTHPDKFDEIIWVLFDERTKGVYDSVLEKE